MSEPTLEQCIRWLQCVALHGEVDNPVWTDTANKVMPGAILTELRRLQKIDGQMMVYGTLQGRIHADGHFEPIDLNEMYKDV